MTKKKRTILLHITGILLFLLMPIVFSPDFLRGKNLFFIPPFQRNFVAYCFLLIVFYVHSYILIPKYYFTKKYLYYGIFTFLCFVLIALLPQLLISDTLTNKMPFVPEHKPAPVAETSLFKVIEQFWFQFVIVITASFLWKITQRWQELEEEKLNSELLYLKSQIRPHFLFNTLNGIYSAAIQEKAQKTATSLVQLSGMMRYLTTEVSQNFVSLEKELNYIKDYVSLQKMRLGDTLELDFQIKVKGNQEKIAPLLLISFIENAFKYGVNPENKTAVIIHIYLINSELQLYVENTIVNQQISESEKSGLGIKNAQNRLNLLYSDKYELVIQSENNIFSVNLKLHL